MKDPSQPPWSNNPNGPRISHLLYTWEKAFLAGGLIGATLYGFVIVLFFRCMIALLSPVNHMRRGVNWGLVVHTATMFLLVTIYVTMTLSLNALLTLMIITRLILHSRNVRKAVGTTAGVTGLYKAIVTMLVESSALYAASLVLTAGPWVAGSYLQDIFTPILAEVQVIAPFLITLRVANRTALTSEMTTLGYTESIRFRTQGESVGGNGTSIGGDSTSLIDAGGEMSGKFGVGAWITIDEGLSTTGPNCTLKTR